MKLPDFIDLVTTPCRSCYLRASNFTSTTEHPSQPERVKFHIYACERQSAQSTEHFFIRI